MSRGHLLVLCAALSACAATPPRPETVSEALLDAMARGDARALASLTGRSEPETRLLVEDAGDELAIAAAEARARPVELRGRAYLESGGVVVLVYEEGGWQVVSGVLGVPSLERPTDAIRALHVLLGRVDRTGFATILSRDTRLVFQEELERWWRGTADPDALRIEIDGDSAIATTPSGGSIELRREAGEWRVVDLR